jgi:iron complex outermembrane recepter protein
MKVVLFSAFFIFLFQFAFSQSFSPDSVRLGEVVVTASKVYRPVGNVTQKIDVITNQEAQLFVLGMNNIAEIIGTKPGLSVSALSRNDANWGTFAGIGPKYSTFMLNGLPLDAFTDPMSLDLMAFERIEFQRGPASVLYPNYLSQDFAGNQSPLAGTVNLITRDWVRKPMTAASIAYGSFNTLNGQLFHQGRNKNIHYFAGTNYESSDYTNYGTEGSWLKMQKDPEYIKKKIYGGATAYFGDSNEHKISFFYNHTDHSGDAGRVYRGFDHKYNTINVNHSSEISQSLTLNSGFGIRTYDRNWQESNYEEVDVLVSNNGVFQRIVPVDVNLAYKPAPNHLIILGVDYQGASYYTRNDPLLGYSQYDNKSRAMQTGIYAQEEFTSGNLVLRGGIRYNHIRHTIDLISGDSPGDESNEWNKFLYSAGLKYHILPTLEFFANAGNSFLSPGLKSIGGTIPLSDKFVEGRNGHLPNPDLKPESGFGADYGFTYRLNDGSTIAIRGFYNTIQDAIIDERVSEVPSQSQSINAGKTVVSGLEFESEQRISQNLSWFANCTYIKSEITESLDADQKGAAVPFAPEMILNAGINLSTNFGLLVQPVVSYTNGYYDSSSFSERKMFKPGTLINLYVSQSITSQYSQKVDVFARAYNITNNRYEMPWQFQDTGFSLMAGVKIVFE